MQPISQSYNRYWQIQITTNLNKALIVVDCYGIFKGITELAIAFEFRPTFNNKYVSNSVFDKIKN